MNTNYVIFENSGEIDIRAITTFGCSVKETSNPIGFFGTGLKYALAVLTRLNHKIWIQCGQKTLRVSAAANEVRGKEFQFVELGEQPCGFTTELGKTWKPWMAYRELYCNAMDEVGGSVYQSSRVPEAESGKTRIIVQGGEIDNAHNHRSEYILEGEPMATFGDIQVFHRPSKSFFYKGIRVMDFERQSMFTYNFIGKLDLTEDRTVANHYEPMYKIARAILGNADRDFLKKVLTASQDRQEFYLDYHGWNGTEPHADFFPTVAELQSYELTKVNNSALRLWREKGRGFFSPKRLTPTKVQAAILEKALDFCEQIGYPVRSSFPILVVESLGEQSTLAAADTAGSQIFLTQQLFNASGTKGVARALVEEYIHLRFKLSDETREMQNHLFAKLISLGEEMTGKPL